MLRLSGSPQSAPARNGFRDRFPATAMIALAAFPGSAHASTNIRFSSGLGSINRVVASNFQADLAKRIAILKELAEDEGLNVSPYSEMHLNQFIIDASVSSLPEIYVKDSGNLRAVWHRANQEQVGLQFFPNGTVQWVTFKHRGGFLARATGIDTVEGALSTIKSMGLAHLMQG